MGRLVRFIYVLILVCLTIGLAKGQTTNGPHKAEPSTFYPDDESKDSRMRNLHLTRCLMLS